MDNDTKSAREIERDIENDRANLARTLDQLSHKLSLDGLMGDVGNSVKRNSGEIGRAVTQAVKDNPLALALTTAGIAWLFSGQTVRQKAAEFRSDARSGSTPPMPYDASRRIGSGTAPRPTWAVAEVQHRSPTAYGTDPSDDGAGIGARIANVASDARDGVVSAASHAKDAVVSAAHSVADTTSRAATSAQRRAHDLREQLSFDTEGLSEAARERVIAARQKAVEFRAYANRTASSGFAQGRDLVQQHPFVAGAALLAIGGAIAASLPRTRYEDDEFGRYSDDLIADAERIAREEVNRAKETGQRLAHDARAEVNDLADDVRKSAKRQISEVESDASDVARKARETVETRAKEAGKSSKTSAK